MNFELKRAVFAAGLGIAALLGSAKAWAWTDLVFSTNQSHTENIILRCVNANHPAPCSAGGPSLPVFVSWNPLDGDRTSHYELTLEGSIKVDVRMSDRRQACSVAQPDPWKNGWSWMTTWRGPDGVEHQREVCTDSGTHRDPAIWLTARRLPESSGAFIYVLTMDTRNERLAPNKRPSATFVLRTDRKVLQPSP